MSPLLTNTAPGASAAAGGVPPEVGLRRVTVRAAWLADPVVRLRHLPAQDALVVEILPLPSATDRVVADLLCLEFDGEDRDALPTALCLTGLTARPGTVAQRCARHVLGTTLWAQVEQMLAVGEPERTVVLNAPVLDSRLRAWRGLSELAIGVEIGPELLRAALVGPDGEVLDVREAVVTDMSPKGVVGGIARLVDEVRAGHPAVTCGAPLVLGVQIAGPVDHARGVVHHFSKRSPRGPVSWGWHEVPLREMVETAVGLPATVLNDVVAYAAVEQCEHPAERGVRAVLLIAQGIGGKLIVDGRIDTRTPVELGNIVVHEGGRLCDCGGRGCVEATAGTLAIVEEVARVTGRPVRTIGEAVTAAEPREGPVDEAVLAVFAKAGRDLAQALGAVQAIEKPDSWAVYGPEELVRKDSEAAEVFLAGLLSFRDFVSFKPYRDSDVQRRSITGAEGARGAALAALHGVVTPSRTRRRH